MAPVAIAPRSPFFFHPTLVTPFEPIIPYVEIFDLNQTPVTTFDDVSTYSSPSQNISTPYSPRYVNDSNPARPVPSVSSVTDDKGNTRPGYEWCCKEWRNPDALKRHMRTKKHFPPLKCQADPTCGNLEAQQRDMNRHYERCHRKWAEKNNKPSQRKQCEGCGKVLSRKDFHKRHIKKGSCPAQRTRTQSGSTSEKPPLLPKNATQ